MCALADRRASSYGWIPIRMEGLYKGGQLARMLLSTLRPAGRVFTCAHEFGHHLLGNGFTIDEILKREGENDHTPRTNSSSRCLRLLVDANDCSKTAFVKRKWLAGKETPAQLYTVACSFTVGYTAPFTTWPIAST